MGDADTGNDHLSDVDLPSQSALASLAEQPGDAAAKPRPKAAKLLKEKNSDSLPFVLLLPMLLNYCADALHLARPQNKLLQPDIRTAEHPGELPRSNHALQR